MKREIKFRVWTGSKMEENILAGNLGVFYASKDSKDTASAITTIYPENIPVMQFTGIKDVNGVEIYEGDVVKINGTKEFFKIIWLDAGLTAISQTGYCVTIWRFPHTVEVFGNIYENLELLENKN